MAPPTTPKQELKSQLGGGNSSRNVIDSPELHQESRGEGINFTESDLVYQRVESKNPDIWFAVTPEDDFDAYGIRAISSADKIDNTITYKKYFGDASVKTDGDYFGVLPEEVFDPIQGTVYTDFTFHADANGYITIYPIFWNTSSTHILGVYFTDSNGYFPWIDTEKLADGEVAITEETNFIDIWKSKSGTLTYYDPDNDYYHAGWGNCSYYISNGKFNIETSEGSGVQKWDDTNLPAIKASGIKIKFTKATDFGFYIKVLTGSKTSLTLNSSTSHNDYDHIYFSHDNINQYYGRILGPEAQYKDGYSGDYSYYIRDQITEDYSNGWAPIYKSSSGETLVKDGTYSFNNNAWEKLCSSNSCFWNVDDPILYQSYSAAAYLPNLNVYNYAGQKVRTQSYFCFEDWPLGSDLNDLIFIVKELNLTVTSDGEKINGNVDTPFTWIIAAEDLGTTDDFDFNDMVVGVTVDPVNDGGEDYNTITFNPLAAGGTMPIYLHFDPVGTDGTTALNIVNTSAIVSDITEDGILYPHYLVANGGTTPEKADCEWHNWFDSGYSSSTMINTGTGSSTATTLHQCQVTVDGTFSLTKYSNVSSGKFNGFYIEVVGNSGTTTDPTNQKDANDSWIIGAKSDFSVAPQMFVIPDEGPSSGTWRWPSERTHILTAYPNFQGWAENHNSNQDWHKDTANQGSGRAGRSGTPTSNR